MKRYLLLLLLVALGKFSLAQCTAVSISSHPQNRTANVGSTATFSISVNGTSPRSYFWYKNNSQISGAISSSYTTPTLTASDNGNTYKCIVTNCNSTYQATSNNATLTVNTPCTAVSISSHPQNQTANVGSTATFSVSVNGTSPRSYFWYKNNSQISGATSSSYTTPTLTASDDGNTFKCIVTNCNSTYQATSNNATLTVNTPCTAVSISSHPQNQTANVGSTATLSVSVNGTSPRSYFWYKNNSQISGATSSSYTTPTLTASDNGNTYKCIITNCNSTYQATSNDATLTVTTPCTPVAIGTHPQNQTTNAGSTATFSVAVNGTSPFLYFWYKNNVQISGATSSSYITPTLSATDNGNIYKCIVTNCNSTYQATTNNAILTVGTPCTAVTIGTHPQNQTKNAGSTATFSVTANGTGPFLYFWYKNNIQISGATSSSYITPTLSATDNGNTYKCIVTNCNSTYQAISNNATLSINASCIGVSIASQPQNQIVNTGNTATFSVSANGTAPFLYFWYKNGVQIPGALSSSYTTPILTTSDNGNYYYCLITNCNSQNGTSTNRVNLSVNSSCSGVTIISQPQSQSGAPSTSATFSLSTFGTSPFYQWQYSSDGGNIWNDVPNIMPYSNPTFSTLNIYPLSISRNGYKYRCKITGFCTSAFYTNVVLLSVQSKLWINSPSTLGEYTINKSIQINWGDFVLATSVSGQTGFVQKKYKIEDSNDNGASWHVIESSKSFSNLLSNQNNTFIYSYSFSSTGSYKLRITDVENPINFNISSTFNIVNNGIAPFTSSLNWDKSLPTQTVMPNPVGLAADGTSRIIIKLNRVVGNTKTVKKISAQIVSPNSLTGVSLLGKITPAQHNSSYSVEGNKAVSTSCDTIFSSASASQDFLFWYVAPDDFTEEVNNQDAERTVNISFTITYSDNSTLPLIVPGLRIVRPPVIMVHGINGSSETFEKTKYNVGTGERYFKNAGGENNLFKVLVRSNLKNYASYKENAEILLGIGDIAYRPQSFQRILKQMHDQGFASNKLDYISHSMGGCIARTVINQYDNFYKGNNQGAKYRNYNQGFINKLIAINAPFNGSPFADFIDDLLNGGFTTLSLLTSKEKLGGFFVRRPTSNRLLTYYDPSPAIKDLQAVNGGVRFQATTVKNHLIGGDIDKYNVPDALALVIANDPMQFVDYLELMQALNPVAPILAVGITKVLLIADLIVNSFNAYISLRYQYGNFLSNSDMVVPITSQFAGRSQNSIRNLEDNLIIQDNASVGYDLGRNHIQITDDIHVGTTIMRLLNSKINSPYFANDIPANNNPDGVVYRIQNQQSILDSVFYYVDTSYIKIINPTNPSTAFVDSTLNINFLIKDTLNLQKVRLVFQGEYYESYLKIFNQSINVKVHAANIGNNILVVDGMYDSLGYKIYHTDTVTVKVQSLDTLKGIYVSPKTQNLTQSHVFSIQTNAIFKNGIGKLNENIDSLKFQIADTNVVRFDSISYQFVTKDTGSTHIVFSYKGFIDTAFVYLSYNDENANISNLCPQGNTLFSAGVNDQTKSYQWQVDAGSSYINVVDNSLYSGATTSTLTLSNTPTSFYGYSYRCIISDGIGSNITFPQTLKFSAVWTGTSNNVWENSANWNCGVLPDENTDVIINFGMPVYPVINSNASIRSLTLKQSATIIVGSGYKLNVKGQSQ